VSHVLCFVCLHSVSSENIEQETQNEGKQNKE
jgi:hypothetical protein